MGPLDGVKVLELAVRRPGPVCGHGAGGPRRRGRARRPGRPSRRSRPAASTWDLLNRGRPSVAVDLKHESRRRGRVAPRGGAPTCCSRASARASPSAWASDPSPARRATPRLLYGRATGWGQSGPYASTAGHDINYLAVVGRARACSVRPSGRRCHRSTSSATSVAAACSWRSGSCAALRRARALRGGQVVDAAMVDGAALLSTFVHGMRSGRDGGHAAPTSSTRRRRSTRSTSAPTASYVAVGAVEPEFYGILLDLLGISGDDVGDQIGHRTLALGEARFAEVFAGRHARRVVFGVRRQRCLRRAGPGARRARRPSAPRRRSTFVELDGVRQPAPAPRFSRTPAELTRPPARPG